MRARAHARSTRPPQEAFSTSARRASLRSLLPARAGRRRFACTSRSSHSGGRQKAIHSRADARTSSESDGTPPPLVRQAAAEPFAAAAPAAATSPPPLPLFPRRQPPRPCRASGSESPKFGKVLRSTHPNPDGRCSRGISSRGPQCCGELEGGTASFASRGMNAARSALRALVSRLLLRCCRYLPPQYTTSPYKSFV